MMIANEIASVHVPDVVATTTVSLAPTLGGAALTVRGAF